MHLVVSAWWWIFVGSSTLVPVVLFFELDQPVVVHVLPLPFWYPPDVVAPLLEVQDQDELLEDEV